MEKKKLILLAIILFIIIVLAVLLNIRNNLGKENTIEETNNILSKVEEGEKLCARYVDIFNGNYYVKYETEGTDEDGETYATTVEVAIKDDEFAIVEDSLATGIVKTGGYINYILHNEELILRYALTEEDEQELDTYKIMDDATLINNFTQTGEEEIDGKRYYFEEYKSDYEVDSLQRYYFEGDTLKYTKTITGDTEEIMKILEISATPPDTLFEIPSNYEISEI